MAAQYTTSFGSMSLRATTSAATAITPATTVRSGAVAGPHISSDRKRAAQPSPSLFADAAACRRISRATASTSVPRGHSRPTSFATATSAGLSLSTTAAPITRALLSRPGASSCSSGCSADGSPAAAAGSSASS